MRLSWSESRDCHKGWITDASKQHFFAKICLRMVHTHFQVLKKKPYQIKRGIKLEEILCHMLDTKLF